MKKKAVSALLAAWLCLFLSGCSSFAVMDTKSLMAPPKANADQQAIHKLLQGNRQDLTFVYPKSGDFRSAIIMHDFTGDGEKDALGFFSLGDAAGVEARFLTKSQGEWVSIAAFNNTATQVDRVCFGDLTGSGAEDVLIGWGSAAGTTGRTAAVNAYHFSEGAMTEYPLGIYGEMAVTDLDGDGVSEVFTVDKFLPAEEEGDQPSPAKARVYAWQAGAMAETYSADADNSISTYSAVASGLIAPGLQGVLLDGAKADGSLTTQIFYLDQGQLKNAPDGVNSEDYVNLSSRPSTASFSCRDINGDGTLEIPVVTELPGIPEDMSLDPTSYLVEWSGFQPEDGSLHREVRALMNTGENYWFSLPFAFEGRITASNDQDRRAVTYTEVMAPDENGDQLLGSPLFSIRVFTRSSWESWGKTGGYELLASQNDSVYGIQVMTVNKRYLEYIQWVRRDFKLLSE